ncbi:hypothetical protein J7T55_009686 [Diaporthe amygdali]|uniref:uncharacterized protein n=1 Tax=Phomopsis amygdali TaxID=1214568 RepID=UPI0022FF1FB4|nr:uncharacterized protein J7T55_009686 [Diaporthe amygdali]KAJ0104022.1 hypothetical protein J7T55_009686 [Diaporthe amygdali]
MSLIDLFSHHALGGTGDVCGSGLGLVAASVCPHLDSLDSQLSSEPKYWSPWTHRPYCQGAWCVHTHALVPCGQGISIITHRSGQQEAAATLATLSNDFDEPSCAVLAGILGPNYDVDSAIDENRAYEVRDSKGKGKGVFATRKIPRGTIIMIDHPIMLKLEPEIDNDVLSENQRSRLFDHAATQLSDPDQVLSLAQHEGFTGSQAENAANYNSFQVDLGNATYSAVFPRVSRINHACVPNCRAKWAPNTLSQTIWTVQDIQPGDELSISYERRRKFAVLAQEYHRLDHYDTKESQKALQILEEAMEINIHEPMLTSATPLLLQAAWTAYRGRHIGMARRYVEKVEEDMRFLLHLLAKAMDDVPNIQSDAQNLSNYSAAGSNSRECLGYSSTKPIVWTGVACRRKTSSRKLEGSRVLPTSTESHRSIDADYQILSSDAAVSANPTDPVFQGLSLGTRRNIEYLLMTQKTVVRDIIVAISVYHQARAGVASFPTAQSCGSSMAKTTLDSSLINDTTVLMHACKATQSLRAALSNADCSDAVVASSFLFTWLDMLDTQMHSWHHHLDGMKDLMCLRETNDASASTGGSVFQGFFHEAYAMTKIDPTRELPQFDLGAVLQRAQSWSWTGCPAELVEILHDLNTLQSQGSNLPQNDVSSILSRLEKFSCSEWALHFPGKDLHQQRLHMASAYKGAIVIFASQALNSICDNPFLVDEIVDLTLHHLKQISPIDSHFKGILWPAFILGAETRLPEQQMWISSTLEQLYGMIHMWNIKRGLSVLCRLWDRPLPADGRRSWLEEVYDMDERLMLI